MKLEIVPSDEIPWRALDEFRDRTCFQKEGWLRYVCDVSGGTPIVAALLDGNSIAGYLSGILVKRAGVRIFGSPFPGWGTPFLGFNLRPEVSRADAIAASEHFIFKDLKCQHFEISDPYLEPAEMTELGYKFDTSLSYRTDLTLPEDELFSRMKSACRRCIRKAEKEGVVIEEASAEGFADEFYEQLIDVFAKQGLTPTYKIDRVEKLIKHVHPSGDLLLVRAREPESGQSIATGIFSGSNQISYFWGNASLRSHQIYRPNEALHWFILRYWKNRGIKQHFWGGGGLYKKKYGGEPHDEYVFRKSSNLLIDLSRSGLRKAYYSTRGLKTMLYQNRENRRDPADGTRG